MTRTANRPAAPITTIDRATHKLICAKVAAYLVSLGQELGVTFDAGGGKLGLDGGTSAVLNVTVTVADKSAVSAAAKAEWDKYFTLFGLRPEVLGMTFTLKGVRYTVAGLDIGRRSRPVKCTRQDGKVFIFKIEDVRTLTKTTLPDVQGTLTEVSIDEAWGRNADLDNMMDKLKSGR